MSTLSCILHPHHVSLLPHSSFSESLHQQFRNRVDPYYEYDGIESHRGVGRPRFDVIETEDRYLLDGELPGVEKKSQVTVEWLQNQVLIIRAVVTPVKWAALEKAEAGEETQEGAPAESQENAATKTNKAEGKATKPSFPRHLVNERKFGEFQRSFTFPAAVDADAMTATLEDGILKIEVPKKEQQPASEKKTIPVG
ncbi:hypothetical protein B7463_g5076, partial [Scytalidium lignicola]